MLPIINFQDYVNSREEEKNRIRKLSALSTRSQNVKGLLHNIDDIIECLFVTKHFNELNQIIGKQNNLDGYMMKVVIDALKAYDAQLCGKIDELNNNMKKELVDN